MYNFNGQVNIWYFNFKIFFPLSHMSKRIFLRKLVYSYNQHLSSHEKFLPILRITLQRSWFKTRSTRLLKLILCELIDALCRFSACFPPFSCISACKAFFHKSTLVFPDYSNQAKINWYRFEIFCLQQSLK